MGDCLTTVEAVLAAVQVNNSRLRKAASEVEAVEGGSLDISRKDGIGRWGLDPTEGKNHS